MNSLATFNDRSDANRAKPPEEIKLPEAIILPSEIAGAIRAMSVIRVPTVSGSMMTVPGGPILATRDLVIQARQVLRSYEPRLRPDWALAKQWLFLLNAGVARSITDEGHFAIKVGALFFVLEGIPAELFGKLTLKDALSQFKFFPSGSELVDFMDAHQRSLEENFHYLRKIANTRVGEMTR